MYCSRWTALWTRMWTLRKPLTSRVLSRRRDSHPSPWRISMLRTLATLTVGLGAYMAFLVAAIYGISFTLGGILPAPFDVPHTAALLAFLIDVGLLALFGVQHSVMARAGWKQWWTSIVPPALERSLYVLLASALLLALFWLWQPIPTADLGGHQSAASGKYLWRLSGGLGHRRAGHVPDRPLRAIWSPAGVARDAEPTSGGAEIPYPISVSDCATSVDEWLPDRILGYACHDH